MVTSAVVLFLIIYIVSCFCRRKNGEVVEDEAREDEQILEKKEEVIDVTPNYGVGE
jgi:hypothetical protein